MLPRGPCPPPLAHLAPRREPVTSPVCRLMPGGRTCRGRCRWARAPSPQPRWLSSLQEVPSGRGGPGVGLEGIRPPHRDLSPGPDTFPGACGPMRSSSPRTARRSLPSAGSHRPSTFLCSAQVCFPPTPGPQHRALWGGVQGLVNPEVRRLQKFGLDSRTRMHLCVPSHSRRLWLLSGSSGGLLGPAGPLLGSCTVPGGPCPVRATTAQLL